MDSQFALLRSRRFLPLFIVQFLGAFNDNLFKSIVIVFIAYGIWDIHGWDAGVLVAFASGLFIIPFVIFCPFAGVLTDRYDIASIIRYTKLAEVFVALLAAVALYSADIYVACIALLALAVQSAFFTPCKFAILPKQLKAEALIGANALVSMGTYLAIVSGTIMGSLLGLLQYGFMVAAVVILLLAVIGFWASLYIPKDSYSKKSIVSFSVLKRSYLAIVYAAQQKAGVFISILGVAYFYFVAATFHAQFPNFTKQTLGADNIVLTMFMVMFSFGIIIGGLCNHVFLKGRIHGALVPIACVFMGVFGIDIYFAAMAYPKPDGDMLYGLGEFVSKIHGIRLLLDTFLQAVACGFYVIPLRAIVQHRTKENVRGHVISGSNMMEAIFILLSAVLSAVLLGSIKLNIEQLYLTVSVITLLFAGYLYTVQSLKEVKI